MRIKIFFTESSSVPEIKKIIAVSEKQLHIKRVVNDVSEVADFDFSNLSDGKNFYQSKDSNVYTVEALSDSTTFIKVASGVPSGGSVPQDIDIIGTTFPFYPYLASGETETSETTDSTPSGLPTAETSEEVVAGIRKAAVSHARTCIDLMNAGWAIDNSAAFSTSNRWRNTRLWILSGLAVIDAILGSSDKSWGYDAGKNALDVYRSLIPADRERIETWYFAHSEAIWNVYFTENSGNVLAYFNWSNGADIPAFASDASSSTAWDGTGDTLDVDFAADATPEDFSS